MALPSSPHCIAPSTPPSRTPALLHVYSPCAMVGLILPPCSLHCALLPQPNPDPATEHSQAPLPAPLLQAALDARLFVLHQHQRRSLCLPAEDPQGWQARMYTSIHEAVSCMDCFTAVVGGWALLALMWHLTADMAGASWPAPPGEAPLH